MKLHGLEVGMYKHESNTMEAAWDTFLKVADEFVATNRPKFTWVTEKQTDNPKYRDTINETYPARASQLYYVKDGGVLTATEL